MSDNNIRVSGSKEHRTRRVRLLGGRTMIVEEERAVKLATETVVDYSSTCPTNTDEITITGIDETPPENPVLSSDIDWNPITGKYTKTTIVRLSAGPWTKVSQRFEDEQQDGNNA